MLGEYPQGQRWTYMLHPVASRYPIAVILYNRDLVVFFAKFQLFPIAGSSRTFSILCVDNVDSGIWVFQVSWICWEPQWRIQGGGGGAGTRRPPPPPVPAKKKEEKEKKSALGFFKSDHRSTMSEGRLNALLRL